MLSNHTIEQTRIIRNLIQEHGSSYQLADGLYQYGVHAIKDEGEVEYGLECLSDAKKCLEEVINKETKGGTWEMLDEWGIENGTSTDLNDLYYKCLFAEAEYDFESFCLYMERYRKPDKRFYAPRREVLKVVAEDLMALENRKDDIRFYGLSLPPRIGKLISDDTPVLTKDGWKKHGDLVVGDYVVGRHGEWVKITHVHKKHIANKRVWFSDHTYIDCHENHEWVVYDTIKGCESIVETKQIEMAYMRYSLADSHEEITNVETIEPKQGNCITVEGGMYRVGEGMKLTHNSTICLFFIAWVMCKRPNSHNACGGHSSTLMKGFYKELLNLITTPEYTFKELYDYMHPEYADQKFPTNVSAEDCSITLGDPDRFPTAVARGYEATWTGAVDVSSDGYLYIDDLIKNREESLSPERMDKVFQAYANEMLDRTNSGSRQLMVGTLWSVIDPLERLRVARSDDPRYKFRRIPALNENDESNFQYKRHGFTTEHYHEMRQTLDDPEWQAKFMQRPYVREGLLFPPDELNYFNGIMPDGEYRIISACDCSFGGGDNLSMPIGREYADGSVYVFDWIHNAGAKEVTLPLVTAKIIENDIRQIRFEGNQGGDMYADYVDKILRTEGYKCSTTSKKAPNTMAKMEKIIAYSGDIKRNYYFISPKKPTKEDLEQDRQLGIKRYVRSQEYQRAMDELCMVVSVGKNVHEDAADAITQLEMFREGNGAAAKVEAIKNPFKQSMWSRW